MYVLFCQRNWIDVFVWLRSADGARITFFLFNVPPAYVNVIWMLSGIRITRAAESENTSQHRQGPLRGHRVLWFSVLTWRMTRDAELGYWTAVDWRPMQPCHLRCVFFVIYKFLYPHKAIKTFVSQKPQWNWDLINKWKWLGGNPLKTIRIKKEMKIWKCSTRDGRRGWFCDGPMKCYVWLSHGAFMGRRRRGNGCSATRTCCSNAHVAISNGNHHAPPPLVNTCTPPSNSRFPRLTNSTFQTTR